MGCTREAKVKVTPAVQPTLLYRILSTLTWHRLLVLRAPTDVPSFKWLLVQITPLPLQLLTVPLLALCLGFFLIKWGWGLCLKVILG